MCQVTSELLLATGRNGVKIMGNDIVMNNESRFVTAEIVMSNRNNIAILRVGLKKKLEDANEKAEADLGYRGEPNTLRHPHIFISKSDIKAKKMSRGRHEKINHRMKQFICLSQTFCHNVNNHQDVFQAVAVITQISFDCGEKPWQCTY